MGHLQVVYKQNVAGLPRECHEMSTHRVRQALHILRRKHASYLIGKRRSRAALSFLSSPCLFQRSYRIVRTAQIYQEWKAPCESPTAPPPSGIVRDEALFHRFEQAGYTPAEIQHQRGLLCVSIFKNARLKHMDDAFHTRTVERQS